MLDITNFWLFALSVFLLSVTPGPDMAYVIGQSMANGRRAGVISATGIALGSCAHAIASVIGLTALLTASPIMFAFIKYTGAVYLIYLGGKMIIDTLGRENNTNAGELKIKKTVSSYSLLSKGFITTLTNPKVLLFFISFFPQFVQPEGNHHAESFLTLGIVYAFIAYCTDTMFAILAGSTTNIISKNIKLQNILNRVIGTTFIALGVRLALTRR